MEAQPKKSLSHPFALLLALEALMIFGCFLTPYFTARPGHDQSSYLFEAQRFLSGTEIYGPHLSETNPPMIIWFSSLPVLLARWMHGSPVFFLRLIVFALILGSTAWCVRILRRSAKIVDPAALGLLACAVLAVEFSIGPYNFGQREHLLIILVLPYILAIATGAVYRLSFADRCVLGVAAGIAIWFKPHDALVIVGLELFLLFRTRSIRRAFTPEFLSLVLTGSFVLLLVRVFTPLYSRVTLPLLFDAYWALGTMNTLPLALSLHAYMLIVLGFSIVCVLFRNSLRDPATSVGLLVCSVVASFAFDIQHTDWWYHKYPHLALLLLALAYLLTDFLYPVLGRLLSHMRLLRRMAFAASGFMAVLLCAIAIHPRILLTSGTHSRSFDLDEYLAQYKPSTTVYVFSTSVAPLSFAFNRGLNWGSRFAHLWMMPAIIQNELGPTGPPAPFKRLPPEAVARLATLQRTESAEDLNYWKPSVVFVAQCNQTYPCQGIEGKDFNMLSWFLQSPEFAAAWSHYQRQPDVSNFAVYKLVP